MAVALAIDSALPRRILSKPIELMHPFVKHGHDPDGTVGQQAPVDVMMLIAAVEALHANSAGTARQGIVRDVISSNFANTPRIYRSACSLSQTSRVKT